MSDGRSEVHSRRSRIAAFGSRFDSSHREGRRMRRTSTIVTVLFCAVTGCRGSEAQEPYAGLVAAPRAAMAATPAVVQVPQSEPSGAEMNVPWAIALLSDTPEAPTKKPGKLAVAAVEFDPTPEISPEADVHLAVEPRSVAEKPAADKPATTKSCSGVVNRRS